MTISDRTTARIVGWLFIGTFVFSIPGYLLYGPLLDHPDYVLGAGHDIQITVGAFLEILTAICNIGTAVVAATGALFGVYERQSAPQFLLTVPEIIWEATFGIYLVAKGFSSPATSREADPRRASAPVTASIASA